MLQSARADVTGDQLLAEAEVQADRRRTGGGPAEAEGRRAHVHSLFEGRI